MACSITITSISGTGTPGNPPTLILIEGTATDCQQIVTGPGSIGVVVTITCGGAPISAATGIAADGTWEINVPIPATSGCRCGNPVTVTACCVTDPNCCATFSGTLSCTPCPIVELEASVGACTPAGTHNVTLTAAITPPNPAPGVAQWDFGDGLFSGAFTFTGPTTNVTTHSYAPGGPYILSLAIILPSGCPPAQVTVGPLGSCPCPEVVDLTAAVSGCAGSGSTATVTLTGSVPSLPPGCLYHWDFGDGSPDATTTTPTAIHDYAAPGAFAVAVTLVCGACVRTTTIMATVPACCPRVTGLSGTIEGCVDDAGNTATVTFVATTDPAGAPGTFSWSFGDGGTATTTVPTATHTYTTSGSMAAEVTFSPAQPGCPQTTSATTVTIPVCGSDVPPPPPTGEGGGCKGLRWAGVILSILGSLSLYICICVPGAGSAFCWAALGLAAGAAILFALWLLFCPGKPCKPALLISWQIALGAGIGALYFAPCCPWLWIVGAGLVTAGIAGLIAWAKQCDKTFCEVMAELSIVITVVIVPILGWLAGIPFLAACLNPIVAAAVATLSAGVAIALAKCASD